MTLDPLPLFSGLLVVATVVLAWCTWRLVVATQALTNVQEEEYQRLRPRIRIQTLGTNWGPNLMPTAPIELHILNEGQQETTLSSSKVTARENTSGSRGYPVKELVDAMTGQPLPFPIRIPGAAHLTIHAKLAGTHPEVIKNMRLEWEGDLTRGEVVDPVIRG